MPKRQDIQSILVIGSGPIVIGQAAEFDYAGTQACLALKEEGYRVILINSNPATIMTDAEVADAIYIEPITLEFVSRILREECPDALLPTLGGQTGLNMAIELDESGILDELEIEILGTNLKSIHKAENRDLFRNLMNELNEPVPDSEVVHNLDEAKAFIERVGFPVIVRPAFTLGGTGGGICQTQEELQETVKRGLKYSPVTQCLLEKSIAGFKEIEYEVMRDSNDTAIVVCNMENIDPVGIHTGDSIVVAPSQTLSDREYQMLRNASLKIIRALKIEGGCNVQLAIDPYSFQYYIIEVNPRVSRSSALASKATGYPIAKIAAKIAVGLRLDEMINPVTKRTYASFEPVLDYVVVKIPRWPFDKFESANRTLNTQMKATGEVMALGRTFEEAILKAIRSLDIDQVHLALKNAKMVSDEWIQQHISQPDDRRIFLIGEALRRGVKIETIHSWSQIDLFFLMKFQNIVQFENVLKENLFDFITAKKAKRMGYADITIAEIWETTPKKVYDWRKKMRLMPVYKMVDTCAAEFESVTPYFYGTYEEENESFRTPKESIIVLGSGPIRIGQGVEFDYATVHSIWAIKEAGYEAIIINNNPDTVSTDFSISDKLYFEPLTIEDIIHIIEIEKPKGVVIQFGGQTAINLANELKQYGVKILGTSIEDLDRVENRNKFSTALDDFNIPQPPGKTATSIREAVDIALDIGYPVFLRPSYVLGGRAMKIINNEKELLHYMKYAIETSPKHPVLVDRYITGIEIEVDAISDGENVLIPGIMEQIERTGVHSGDSIAVYPTQNISQELLNTIVDYTIRLAKGFKVIGLLNIQYVVSDGEVFVIEVNPRSSRTIPFLSKITAIPMANIAMKAILGHNIKNQGYEPGIFSSPEDVFVKIPVFSFEKLDGIDITIGPEMKSTGEVLGRGSTFEQAILKGLIAAGISLNKYSPINLLIEEREINDAIDLLEQFKKIDYEISIFRINSLFEEIKSNRITTETILVDINTNSKKVKNFNISMMDNFLNTRNSTWFSSIDTLRAILQALLQTTKDGRQ